MPEILAFLLCRIIIYPYTLWIYLVAEKSPIFRITLPVELSLTELTELFTSELKRAKSDELNEPCNLFILLLTLMI